MVHSFSLFPVPPANHCKKKSLEKEKDFFVIGQLPVPRTVVLELKKNHFCPPLYYQTAQSIIVVKVFYMVYALRHLITPTKSNFFQL